MKMDKMESRLTRKKFRKETSNLKRTRFKIIKNKMIKTLNLTNLIIVRRTLKILMVYNKENKIKSIYKTKTLSKIL